PRQHRLAPLGDIDEDRRIGGVAEGRLGSEDIANSPMDEADDARLGAARGPREVEPDERILFKGYPRVIERARPGDVGRGDAPSLRRDSAEDDEAAASIVVRGAR